MERGRLDAVVVDDVEETEAKCFSTPDVVHWKRSELSEALSLDESGLGDEGAIQLADLAGRGPRTADVELPPPPLPPPTLLCKLLEADDTRRGMMCAVHRGMLRKTKPERKRSGKRDGGREEKNQQRARRSQ